MNLSKGIARYGIEGLFDYLYKDPEKNLRKLMDWADRFSGGRFPGQRKAVRSAIENPDDPYYAFIRNLTEKVDSNVLRTVAINFFVNGNLMGAKIREKKKEELGCNVPMAILLDPTSACNLHCRGCWAAEYGDRLNLSRDEIDSIISQGKELGVYTYIYTGGEPLVRKKDLIEICEKHSDCVFLTFTNGTLIDEAFTEDMLRAGNLIPAISLEGSREATDSRRGAGVYDRVTEAMRLLQEKKLIYGISTCYTSDNFESVSSEEYYDSLIETGAYFIWYFHYMPVGNNASVELLPTPEQREKMYRRIRDYRRRKPLFAMDFQNDGEFVGGCIAGGREYFHINANGDIEPCVFIHYSDSNIREKSLVEALQSPLFMKYHEGQPFNDNMLMPCPMLENPDRLRDIVRESGAVSTDVQSPESVEHLCAKCDRYSENWKPSAERIWQER